MAVASAGDGMGPTRLSTRVLFLGAFVLMGSGLPFVFRLLYSVPEGRVMACATSWSHRYYAHVTLDTGRELSLTQEDILNPRQCLPVGTRVEKRALEGRYRIDGKLVHAGAAQAAAVQFIALCGLLVAAIGWVLRRRGK